MKNCENCKHWSKIDKEFPAEFPAHIEAGHCLRFRDTSDILSFADINIELEWEDEEEYIRRVKEAMKSEPLILSDYYGSGFATKPDFYCSAHEQSYE